MDAFAALELAAMRTDERLAALAVEMRAELRLLLAALGKASGGGATKLPRAMTWPLDLLVRRVEKMKRLLELPFSDIEEIESLARRALREQL